MATWRDFATAAPDLARYGAERLTKRVAFLATSRADGSPRVHPVTPIISSEHLFVFMEPTSPKGHDLKRDARYALHSLITDSNGTEGEFFIYGEALFVEDMAMRQIAIEAASYKPKDHYILFQLGISSAFSNDYAPDGTPIRQGWRETPLK